MSKESLLLHAGEDTIHSNPIEPKTPKEKFSNWWFHHRFTVLVVTLAAMFVAFVFISVFSKNTPDYKILLMTRHQYPMELVSAMQGFMETVADDRDGDGQVEVELNNYVLFVDTENNGDYAQDMFEAARARYASDVFYGESMIILFDAASFHALYEDQLLVYNDGSTPPPDAKDYANMMIPLESCRLFSDDFNRHITNAMYGIEYTEEYIDGLLEPLYVAFRCTEGMEWQNDEKQMAYYYDSWELYRLMIEGRPMDNP